MRPLLWLLVLCAAVSAGCSTQQATVTIKPTPPLQQRDERCLSLEKEFIGMNSQDMSRLFGLALERYEGVMPCIGAAAKFRDATATSSCDGMPHPYILDRVQQGSPAQIAGLRDGDSVDSIDDRPIRFPMDFDVTVLGSIPGSFIPVRIIRGDRSFTGQVRVGAQFPGEGSKCSVLPVKPAN